MNKKTRIQVLSVTLALLLTHSSWVLGQVDFYAMPDLSAATLSLACEGMIEDKTPKAGYSQGLCVGIILGVEDNAHYDQKICIPENIGIAQRIQIVRAYIATQPKRVNQAFASLVFDALIKTWPCTK